MLADLPLSLLTPESSITIRDAPAAAGTGTCAQVTSTPTTVHGELAREPRAIRVVVPSVTPEGRVNVHVVEVLTTASRQKISSLAISLAANVLVVGTEEVELFTLLDTEELTTEAELETTELELELKLELDEETLELAGVLDETGENTARSVNSTVTPEVRFSDFGDVSCGEY